LFVGKGHHGCELFVMCVVRMVDEALRRYQQGLGRGLKPVDAWNLSTCDWVAAVKVQYRSGPPRENWLWKFLVSEVLGLVTCTLLK